MPDLGLCSRLVQEDLRQHLVREVQVILLVAGLGLEGAQRQLAGQESVRRHQGDCRIMLQQEDESERVSCQHRVVSSVGAQHQAQCSNHRGLPRHLGPDT